MEGYIHLNPSYVSGGNRYDKFVVEFYDEGTHLGAYCLIINKTTHKIQCQSSYGEISKKVYHGHGGLGWCTTQTIELKDFLDNPSTLSLAGFDEESINNFKRFFCCGKYYIYRAQRGYINKLYDNNKEAYATKRHDIYKITDTLYDLLGKRFVEAKPFEESPKDTTETATESAKEEPKAECVEATNVIVECPTSRKMATMAKMVNAEYLYGFTNGNYYEIVNDDGEYITIKNDFGLDSKVNKSRCQTLRVFVEEPLEKEYENQ